MSKNLIFTIILILITVKTTHAQQLQTQVESINTFIKENSDDASNYYAKINATQGNIYFYNEIQHVMKLTFPVNKIDANKIKVTKKGLKFVANEKGNFVGKKFVNSESEISTAWLNIINMSKENKVKLKNMFNKFILDYQKVWKK